MSLKNYLLMNYVVCSVTFHKLDMTKDNYNELSKIIIVNISYIETEIELK